MSDDDVVFFPFRRCHLRWCSEIAMRRVRDECRWKMENARPPCHWKECVSRCKETLLDSFCGKSINLFLETWKSPSRLCGLSLMIFHQQSNNCCLCFVTWKHDFSSASSSEMQWIRVLRDFPITSPRVSYSPFPLFIIFLDQCTMHSLIIICCVFVSLFNIFSTSESL